MAQNNWNYLPQFGAPNIAAQNGFPQNNNLQLEQGQGAVNYGRHPVEMRQQPQMPFQNVPPPVDFNRAPIQPHGGRQVQQIHIARHNGLQQNAAPRMAHQGAHLGGQNANHQGFQAQWGGNAARQENNQGRPLHEGQQGPAAQQFSGIYNGAHIPMQRNENLRYLGYGQLPLRQAGASHQAGYAVGAGGYGPVVQRDTNQTSQHHAVGVAPNTMRALTLGHRLLTGWWRAKFGTDEYFFDKHGASSS